MKYRTMVVSPLGVCLLAAALAGQTVWNHNPSSDIGPQVWGNLRPAAATNGSAAAGPNATCGAATAPKMPFQAVGQRQSPIDISGDRYEPGLPYPYFRYGNAMTVTAGNDGHVVEADHPSGTPTLSLGTSGASALDTYRLIRFHFHTLSEHTVGGKHFEAELHLVHQNALGEYLVVGVLLEQRAAGGLVFDRLVQAAAKPGSKLSIDPGQLFPESPNYYGYTGSLTTPPCTEGVRWLVMATPMAVSAAFVKELRAQIAKFPHYDSFPYDNRPVMRSNPGNEIPIWRNFQAR